MSAKFGRLFNQYCESKRELSGQLRKTDTHVIAMTFMRRHAMTECGMRTSVPDQNPDLSLQGDDSYLVFFFLSFFSSFPFILSSFTSFSFLFLLFETGFLCVALETVLTLILEI